MNLMKLADQKEYKAYFFGAREWVVKKVIDNFSQDYPRMIVAGYRHGYYEPAEEERIVEDIRASGADMLFVAMSSPAKELFLSKYLERLNIPFVMGVGGSFDIAAGMTQRAPMWMQKAGLEWFFRLLNEPRRMLWRYLTSNLAFLGMLLKALVLGKKKYDCS